jgi:hypothetical protein
VSASRDQALAATPAASDLAPQAALVQPGAQDAECGGDLVRPRALLILAVSPRATQVSARTSGRGRPAPGLAEEQKPPAMPLHTSSGGKGKGWSRSAAVSADPVAAQQFEQWQLYAMTNSSETSNATTLHAQRPLSPTTL